MKAPTTIRNLGPGCRIWLVLNLLLNVTLTVVVALMVTKAVAPEDRNLPSASAEAAARVQQKNGPANRPHQTAKSGSPADPKSAPTTQNGHRHLLPEALHQHAQHPEDLLVPIPRHRLIAGNRCTEVSDGNIHLTDWIANALDLNDNQVRNIEQALRDALDSIRHLEQNNLQVEGESVVIEPLPVAPVLANLERALHTAIGSERDAGALFDLLRTEFLLGALDATRTITAHQDPVRGVRYAVTYDFPNESELPREITRAYNDPLLLLRYEYLMQPATR